MLSSREKTRRMGLAERDHPDPQELVGFMRGELSRSPARDVVRHLLTGCPQCLQITRRLWKLGEPPLRLLVGLGEDPGSASRENPPGVDGDPRKRTAP